MRYSSILFAFLACCLNSSSWAEPPGYLTYDQIVTQLKQHTEVHPNRTYLYSIGKTVKGRDIWVLALSNSQPDTHVLLRPEVKYVSNIHGQELATGELLMRFIDDLLNNPSNDSRINEILDTTRLHVLVHLDPDTSSLVLRDNCTSFTGNNNSNNYDINMNFPDRFFCQADPMQPETLAVLEWTDSMRFLLSARFFIGYGIVTTYPYENWSGSQLAKEPRETITEDNDVFRFLAKKYALNHRVMPFPAALCQGNRWPDGIVNGGFFPLDFILFYMFYGFTCFTGLNF